MPMVMLDNESAQWAKHSLKARAEDMLKAAKAARSYGSRNVVAAKAANYIATVFERQARELDRAIADINPNPGGEAGRLYREAP